MCLRTQHLQQLIILVNKSIIYNVSMTIEYPQQQCNENAEN